MSSINLKSHDLRETPCRLAVLDCFKRSKYALSYADLENDLIEKFDKVTIYRTLKSFQTAGIIHKVLDDVGGAKFALCNDTCVTHENNHHHDHVHFKCEKCEQTVCFDDLIIPKINLPKGYKSSEINLLIQGICKNCQ